MLSAHRKNDIIKIYKERFVLLDILQYILSAISTVLSLVLIIMIRSVYKELHADRETGC